MNYKYLLLVLILLKGLYGMNIENKHINNLIKNDQWAGISGKTTSGKYIIRYRTPILNSKEIEGYIQLLRIVWIYADENTGALPTETDSINMEIFENHIISTFEKDNLAVLTAVLTFDGARQWVFYTHNISKCSKRINLIPTSGNKPYPIELDTFEDREWRYLTETILQNRK